MPAAAAAVAQLHLLVHDSLLLLLPAVLLLQVLGMLAAVGAGRPRTLLLLLPVIGVAGCCNCWQATDAIAPAGCLTLCPQMADVGCFAEGFFGTSSYRETLTSCVLSNVR